jgi:S1-C subfamily serine protease
MEVNQKSCVSIVNNTVGCGGSGVVVWRDALNTKSYVATAFHVVEGMADGSIIDINYKKYKSIVPVILDKTYDFALLEVSGLPKEIPVAKIVPPSRFITAGADVYVIGWPELFDHNSISVGCIRSKFWNLSGAMNQLVISAPVFGGNSGGGVFLKATNELLGLVSWGLGNDETFNGIIPYNVIYEALLYFMYRPALAVPSRVYCEGYYLGARTYACDPFTLESMIGVGSHPMISTYAAVGMLVCDVVPGSPAVAAGLTPITAGADGYTFDVVWAVSRTGKAQWTYITEEAAFDTIVWKYAYTTTHGRRPMLTTRAKAGDPKTAGLDIVLPPTLEVDVLVSRVIGGVHDNNYVVRRVSLVKRDGFYAANGGDASTFSNEFLYGSRRDLGKAISEKRAPIKDACVALLENLVPK